MEGKESCKSNDDAIKLQMDVAKSSTLSQVDQELIGVAVTEFTEGPDPFQNRYNDFLYSKNCSNCNIDGKKLSKVQCSGLKKNRSNVGPIKSNPNGENERKRSSSSTLKAVDETISRTDSFEAFLSGEVMNTRSSTIEKKDEKVLYEKPSTLIAASDSSDDEREPFEQKYNEFGKFVKARLKSDAVKTDSTLVDFYGNGGKLSSWKVGLNKEKHLTPSSSTKDSNVQKSPSFPQSVKPGKPIKTFGASTDSFESLFGLAVVNPLIMASTLKEKMVGRKLVPFSSLRNHVEHSDLSNDWCIAGAIVSTYTKVSQKGNNYCVWKISDLKLGLKTASLFLFGSSYSALWKTTVGSAVGVLNPSVMDSKKDGNDEAALSVYNSDQVMICGRSRDFGFCKARKASGDECKQFVNKSHCEFCIYHVQKEYKKFSNSRSNLQSSGGGGLQNLRNKVLGKNEVFYAGKSFSAVKPTKPVKTKKIVEKDQKLLSNLFGNTEVPVLQSSLPTANVSPKGNADLKFYSRFQKIKDAELLNRLTKNSTAKKSTAGKKKIVEIVRPGKVYQDGKLNKRNASNKMIKSNNKPSLKTDNKDQSMFSATEFFNSSFSKSERDDMVKKSLGNEEPKAIDNCEKTEHKSMIELLYEVGKSLLTDEEKKSYAARKDKETSLEKVSTINISKQLTSETSEMNTDVLVIDCKKLKQNIKDNSVKIINIKETPKVNKINFEKFCSALSNDSPKEHHENKMLHAATSNTSSPPASDVVKKNNTVLSASKVKELDGKPTLDRLSDLSNNKFIDLSLPITRRDRETAKQNALKYVKKNGPIKKLNPNAKDCSRKRKLINLDDDSPDDKNKKLKTQSVLSNRFVELMNKSSKHDDLLQEADDKCMDEYFLKMTKKEEMEEKMLNTYKVPCKAVRCLKCKYTWYTASDLCKEEQHRIKVVDVMKRFFKCNGCGNRTTTLEIIPLMNCKLCGGSNWQRAPLLSEKKTFANLNQLSIRGGEQKFVNSVITDASLNLLVPE